MPPPSTLASVYQEIQARLSNGWGVMAIARELSVSPGMIRTARRLLEEGAAPVGEAPENDFVCMAEVRRRLQALIERLEAEDGPLPDGWL